MAAGKRAPCDAMFSVVEMNRSGLRVLFIHSSMDCRLARATPPWPTTRASDSMSAATVAEVRRGAWIRLSAASAPSTGRSHFMGRRKSRASSSDKERREQQTGDQREQEAGEEERAVRAEREARDGERRGEQGEVAAQAVLAGAQHLVAAFLQRLNRFDAGGVARGDQGRDDAGYHAHGEGEEQEARIDGDLLDVLRDAEHGFQHVGGDAGEGAREEESEGGAGGGSDQSGDGALAEEERADLSAGGAERAQDADLRAALRDGDGERVVDDEHADEEREHAGDVHHHGVDAEQRFELLAAARGRLDGEAGAEQCGQCGLALLQGDAVLEADIDAVEVAAAAEHVLGGVDVHDGEVAAEGLRHAARFHDAAHGELLVALHGVERDFAADGEVVAVGELAGDDERIGLGEEDERIVDHVLVAVVEVVVAEAAVAGHVDAEDEEVALAGEAGVDLGFDDGHGGADFAAATGRVPARLRGSRRRRP